MAAEAGLVVLTGVNKWFGRLHALKDIDLSIASGEVVVVIGPSGSGKSTLCRTINRLETVDEGTIMIDGRPLPERGASWQHCAPKWAWCSRASTSSPS